MQWPIERSVVYIPEEGKKKIKIRWNGKKYDTLKFTLLGEQVKALGQLLQPVIELNKCTHKLSCKSAASSLPRNKYQLFLRTFTLLW